MSIRVGERSQAAHTERCITPPRLLTAGDEPKLRQGRHRLSRDLPRGMLAIAAMAVLIDDVARCAHSAGFAVAHVVLRTLMLGLYWHAWRAFPEARPLIRF